jgi:hypothetical protein
MPLKDGSRVPLLRKVCRQTEPRAATAATTAVVASSVPRQHGIRIGAGNFAHGDPAEAADERAD